MHSAMFAVHLRVRLFFRPAVGMRAARHKRSWSERGVADKFF